MLRRIKQLVQASLLLTFLALIMLLFGWKEGQVRSEDPGTEEIQRSANVVPYEQIQEPVPLDPRENDLLYRPPIDVAFIFTHAKDNWSLQNQLRIAAGSLLSHSSAPIRLHLITDEDGFHAATKIITFVQTNYQLDSKNIKLVYVSADDFIPEIEPSVKIMQEFFTRRANSYYRDSLFFFSVHLHKLLPGLERVILMDIDIKVKGDIAELYSHFERFAKTNVIAMSREQSPVYRHLLSIYRKNHPNTTLGGPSLEGGFSGFNSGVMLIDVNKLRESEIIKSYLQRPKLVERTQHYSYQGHLGDQDLYTLIALDHPDLFYTLPCGWNKQLCDWWRDHGYQNIFDQYFTCPEELKIIHGNCKAKIPDDL